MKVSDVMTADVMTIGQDAPLKEAATAMVKAGVSGLPVLDDSGKVLGIVTEADFVTVEANRSWGRQRRRLLTNYLGETEHPEAKTVRDVMSKNPYCIDAASTVTEAARMMTDRGVKRLPVVLPDGTLEGIISRADVMGAFARSDETLQREVVEDIAIGVLQLSEDDIAVDVRDGVVHISGVVDVLSEARLFTELASRVEGVVSVESDVTWRSDDTKPDIGTAGI
ncbi:MAG: CBS domain-containing protein [Acidimicrobiia bacterium]